MLPGSGSVFEAVHPHNRYSSELWASSSAQECQLPAAAPFRVRQAPRRKVRCCEEIFMTMLNLTSTSIIDLRSCRSLLLDMSRHFIVAISEQYVNCDDACCRFRELQ